MPSFNQVMLMGNITRDPQLKQLPSQTVVAEFGLAVNRRYRTADGEEREETCFVDCSAFGKQAEVLAEYATKGKPLFVQGRLKYDAWEDKQSGAKRSKLAVVVENFQFVGGRDGSGSFPGAAAQNERQNERQGERHTQMEMRLPGEPPSRAPRATVTERILDRTADHSVDHSTDRPAPRPRVQPPSAKVSERRRTRVTDARPNVSEADIPF